MDYCIPLGNASSERVFSLLKGLVSLQVQMSGTDQVLLDAEATIVAERKQISAATVESSQALKAAAEEASRKKRPQSHGNLYRPQVLFDQEWM